MTTLTANSSGILKLAGADPTFTTVPGKRYAFMWRSAATAGTIYPVVDGTAIYSGTDSAASVVTWSLASVTTVLLTRQGGCEFVATGTTFVISGTGFTEGAVVEVSVVPII